MSLITLDSSVIAAYLLDEDVHHQKALLILDQIFDGQARAMMPCSVLLEVVAAVRRRTGSEATALEVHEILRTTQGMTFLDIIQPMAQDASQIAATHGLRAWMLSSSRWPSHSAPSCPRSMPRWHPRRRRSSGLHSAGGSGGGGPRLSLTAATCRFDPARRPYNAGIRVR